MTENLEHLPLNELRQMWANAWKIKPHARIGRTMLQRSLEFKILERECGSLRPDIQEQLDYLIKKYKRETPCERNISLKPGTRLVRTHEGKKHVVIVEMNGFEFEGRKYKSLSKIANEITGKHWNGWMFFGLKKADTK